MVKKKKDEKVEEKGTIEPKDQQHVVIFLKQP